MDTASTGTSGASRPATLLIVDDTPANLGVAVEYLEAHGLRVVVAQDGEEGLRRAALVVPDLILLDVMLPGLNGFEVCRHLKADARTRDIPVIFMTSLAETHDKLVGFAAGASDYLTKPLHVEEMVARVNAHLNVRTLQRQLEARNAELAATNQELQAFSYSASHDLRAPLRAIAGFAQILRHEHAAGMSEEGLGYLGQIISNTNRMGALIDNLLMYARAGRTAVRMVPVPLVPLLEQLAATFGERIRSTGTRFEVQGPLATPLGDATLLGQILGNLIDNALTYRRHDATPEVRVSALLRDEHVVISVADNGIGIEPEYHDKIFEVFQRLHTADEYPGSGIGLAIVAKSARLMGGEISLESTPGRGSTFSIRLPAARRPTGVSSSG